VYAVRPRGGQRGGRGAGAARLRREPAHADTRGPPQAREQDGDRRKGGARPPAALAGFYRYALNWREARLAAIGAEIGRVRECAGAPHRVAEAALALVRRHIYELEGLSAGAVAAAALWLATYKEYGMLIRLAEAAVEGVKGAARRMRA